MNKLFLGIKGHAVCIDKRTGKEVWRTKLKANWGGITNIMHDDNCVYVYVYGHLYCLDAEKGTIQWKSDLHGLGYGHCIMASRKGGQIEAIHAAEVDSQVVIGG